MARTRNRVDQGPRTPGTFQAISSSGSVSTFPDWATPGNRGSTVCTDTLSTSRPYTVPHDFYLERRACVEPVFNGSWKPSSSQTYVLTNYSNRYLCDVGNCPTLVSQTGLPSFSELALKAIANMNPNTPDIDLPVFVFELKDLPRMMEQIGDLLRTRGSKRPSTANAYLAWAMGWRPLLSDLRAMLSLVELTDKRQKYLQRLAKGTKIKRKLGSGTGERTFATQTWAGATGGAITGTYTSPEWTAWYTAWAKSSMDIPSLDALHTASFDAVLGMTGPSLSSAWEALPWSWLVDYFTTFGDFLAATRGGLPFTWKDLSVMRGTIITRTDTLEYNPKGLAFTPGYRTSIYKERKAYQYTPLPAFRESVLSQSQLRIIGALAVSRSYRVGKSL